MSEVILKNSMSEEIKKCHAFHILSRVTSMKESEFICDFIIKAGGESFPTHRTILAASSYYFEALFSSQMKEALQGFVEIKDLGIKGIQQSLAFMYTGSAEITLECVDDILYAAELFQVNGLKTLCFSYLAGNLSPSNCLMVSDLARKYNNEEIRIQSEEVIIANFKLVIASDMFPLLSRTELLSYLSKVDHQTSWQAAVTWAKEIDELSKLVEGMDLQKFPFKFLWEVILAESLVTRSQSMKNKVVLRLFSDIEELRDNLAMDNCVLLRTLAREYNIPEASVQVITQFLEANFEDLAKLPSFNNLSKEDVFTLLESPTAECDSEETKWKAAIKWVKHDVEQRKKTFSEIFGLIKFEKLSLSYLQNNVRSEPLVKESKKCTTSLMDVVFVKSMEMEAKLAHSAKDTQLAITEAAMPSPKTESVEEEYMEMAALEQGPALSMGKDVKTIQKRGTTAKVLFAHKPQQHDELQLQDGDIITDIVKDDRRSWWMGSLNGKRGMFPSNLVEMLTEEKAQSVPAEEETSSQKVRRARVLFDYDPKNEDELALKVGDVIMDVVDHEDGWCVGTLNGKRGVFPDNFVKMLEEEDEEEKVRSPPPEYKNQKEVGRGWLVEYGQPPGKMSCSIVKSPLPGYDKSTGTIEITYSFPEGLSQGVEYAGKEFKAYLPHTRSWFGKKVEDRLQEAFIAGEVFKLQHRSGDETGEIAWGDIPHKTSKTGGRFSEGFPDSGYMDRLKTALKAKGF